MNSLDVLPEIPVIICGMSVNDSDVSAGNTSDGHIPRVTNTTINVPGVKTLETLVETDVSLKHKSLVYSLIESFKSV